MAQRKKITNLRRIGKEEWTDGIRTYRFAEVDPGTEIIVTNAIPWRILATDGNKKIVSVDNLASWIKGTNNQIIITPNLSGGVAVSLSPGRVRSNTRVISTDSPYTVSPTDLVIFFDTDGGPITANLPAGENGRHYRLINCGSSGNDVTVTPDGTEQMFGDGAGVSFTLYDSEIINIDFETTENWW